MLSVKLPDGVRRATLAAGMVFGEIGLIEEIDQLTCGPDTPVQCHEDRTADVVLIQTFSTKLSTTRFSPALSNAIVSLLPSTATTLPLPNFW